MGCHRTINPTALVHSLRGSGQGRDRQELSILKNTPLAIQLGYLYQRRVCISECASIYLSNLSRVINNISMKAVQTEKAIV